MITKNANAISIDSSSNGHVSSTSHRTLSTRAGARLRSSSAQSKPIYFVIFLSAKKPWSLASPEPISRIVLSTSDLGKNL
jgi:hypothetical protein